MDSVVWQNDKFASSASEVARKRWISKSFYWLTLNLILLLWISAVLSPANVLANISKSPLRDLAAHFLTLSIFIICLLSCFFHSFQLLRALRPFTAKAKGTFYPLSTPDRIFGPNVFSPLKREVSSSSLSGCDIKSWMQTKIQKSPIHPQSSWSPGEPENRSFSEFWFSTMQNEPLAYSPDQTTPPRLPMSSSFSSSFLLNTSIQNSAIGLEKSSAMDNSWSTALARPRWISSPLSSSLASFQYELSPSSDTKPNSAVDDRSLNSPDPTKPHLSSDPRILEQDAQKYWKDNRVTGSDLERWTINIRRWLHGTIVRRVVDEITSVNAKILETSEDAALIGSTTLNTLEQLAFSKYRHISTLPTLIRFLNCTKDQGYLVSRLRELARGSFLEEFRWDGGSKSTTSPWKEHIPTDTLILLHLLSTYMDCRLPPHPKCLSGRSFDQLHVVRHPDKPDLKTKYTAQLYIARIQPPVIKVVLEGTIYVFPPDQRNFYHALLMFFHFYHKQDDTIRSISLGASGLNLSWVFEK